jgi:AcrR family transcriptional regulator
MLNIRYRMAAERVKNQPRSPRLSGERWIDAAIDAIVEGGIAAVSVEPLAERLGATKGSFYHHFSSREALITAALERWEREQTEAVIARLDAIPDPAERLRAVTAAAYADRFGGLRDAALLASAWHPLVRPAVARVTQRRLRYLTDAYRAIGLDTDAAWSRALLLYSAYLGLFTYLRTGPEPPLGDDELNLHTTDLLQALIPTDP